MKILMIQRAERFSPNSVEKDLAILDLVGAKLLAVGHQVTMAREEVIVSQTDLGNPDVVFTMGRLPETLARLKDQNAINSSAGIDNCKRCKLEAIMIKQGFPMAPKEGTDGYWLKRGDATSQTEDDVQFVATRAELNERISAFEARGIYDYTVSAHVTGDLVKFYGVEGMGFFRYYYPTDDGESKFGNEQHNGQARHYPFGVEALHDCTEQLAKAVGIKVYGGDCIVREDGTFCIIDFNDWPSFSCCREEAANAIAALID